MRSLRFLLAIVSTSMIAAPAASAAQDRAGYDNYCECYSERPPVCEAYWNYDVAFVAQVGPFDGKLAIPVGTWPIRVERAWKGVEPGERTVEVGGTGISCGIDFWPGRKYLILGRRDASGTIEVSSCKSLNFTIGTPQADEAIAWLDSLTKPSAGGRIDGDVSLTIPRFEELRFTEFRAVEGAIVNLSGEGLLRNATVVNGRYSFTDLRAGSYSVSVTMPDGLPPATSARVPEGISTHARFEDDYEPALVRSITIPNLHACSHAPFVAAFDGGISGSVLNADGSPAEKIVVEVLPDGIDPRKQTFWSASATTDRHGRYRVGGLMPGRYIAGVNLRDVATGDVPYPAVEHRDAESGERGVVTLSANGQVTLPPFRLPAPAVIRQIHGTLAMADGSPVDDARIEIREAGRAYDSSDQYVGGHGATRSVVWLDFDAETRTVAGQAFEGRTYVIRAWREGPARSGPQGSDNPTIASATATVTIRGDITKLSLVMERIPPR